MSFARTRFGGALVQLVFLAAMFGIVVVFALRFFVDANDTARRLRCAQQMRDLATALNQFEIDRRSYPGYRNVLLMTNNASYVDDYNKEGGVSWAIMVLPYLNETKLFDACREPNSPQSARHVPIKGLLCPSDQAPQAELWPNSYVVNTGCIDVVGVPRSKDSAGMPRDWPANGVFFDRFTGNPTAAFDGKTPPQMPANQIPMVAMSNSWASQRDGMTTTLMLSENLDHGQYSDVFEQSLGMIWDIDSKVQTATKAGDPLRATPTKASYRINSPRGTGQPRVRTTAGKASDSYDYARPSSSHPGGVNMVYLDGHISFTKSSIEYFVYCLLMTPDGKNVKKPGTITPLVDNPYGTPIEDKWLE